MLHTYTVIKKNMSVINHLEWQQAKDIADDGDMILTIKDNHVSAIRKVTVVDYYDETLKECDHIAGSITPFYQLVRMVEAYKIILHIHQDYLLFNAPFPLPKGGQM